MHHSTQYITLSIHTDFASLATLPWVPSKDFCMRWCNVTRKNSSCRHILHLHPLRFMFELLTISRVEKTCIFINPDFTKLEQKLRIKTTKLYSQTLIAMILLTCRQHCNFTSRGPTERRFLTVHLRGQWCLWIWGSLNNSLQVCRTVSHSCDITAHLLLLTWHVVQCFWYKVKSKL